MTAHPSARPAPVIILTMARSGSTLLRFILDSHPELACPPESSLGQVCFTLARLWDLLEPSPQSAQQGYRPLQVPAILPPSAVTSIRGCIDDVFGRYLARCGKRRWCDKSLDNGGIAELLGQVYPDAQFICLYRHCLDVVVSAIEACPWGLGGYGFEQYARGSQGNDVATVALSWLDRTTPIIEFQEKYPDRCHGIRYEDLVAEPEEVVASLFDFLGVAQVPGITAACFESGHETRGPADHKIWFTGSINRASVGRGIAVPVQMIPPDILAQVNQMLAQLDYRQVDDQWAEAVGALDPRAGCAPEAAGTDPADADPGDADAAAAALSARLTAAVAVPPADLVARWPAATTQLALVIEAAGAPGPARGWTLSCTDSRLTSCEGIAVGKAPALAASGSTWLAVLAGQANLAAEVRAGRLRFIRPAEAGPRPNGAGNLPPELHLIAQLLGLSVSVPAQSAAGPGPVREAEMAMAPG